MIVADEIACRFAWQKTQTVQKGWSKEGADWPISSDDWYNWHDRPSSRETATSGRPTDSAAAARPALNNTRTRGADDAIHKHS